MVTRLKNEDRVLWADNVFDKLKDDWSLPYFLPRSSYLVPYCSPEQIINPNKYPFPARGLFISGPGMRTRLHTDPWGSEAILCQIYGRKKFVMYPPDQTKFLKFNGQVVDIDNPDLVQFPRFADANAIYIDELHPGEMVLIPAGWFHHFTTIEPSISLTWNFVHQSTWSFFFQYLTHNPPLEEPDTISYFLNEIPGRLR